MKTISLIHFLLRWVFCLHSILQLAQLLTNRFNPGIKVEMKELSTRRVIDWILHSARSGEIED